MIFNFLWLHAFELSSLSALVIFKVLKIFIKKIFVFLVPPLQAPFVLSVVNSFTKLTPLPGPVTGYKFFFNETQH